METITIKLKGRENIPFLLTLLKKFNFIVEVDRIETDTDKKNSLKSLPVQWATGQPSAKDFAGFWADSKITLDSLRKKAWDRI